MFSRVPNPFIAWWYLSTCDRPFAVSSVPHFQCVWFLSQWDAQVVGSELTTCNPSAQISLPSMVWIPCNKICNSLFNTQDTKHLSSTGNAHAKLFSVMVSYTRAFFGNCPISRCGLSARFVVLFSGIAVCCHLLPDLVSMPLALSTLFSCCFCECFIQPFQVCWRGFCRLWGQIPRFSNRVNEKFSKQQTVKASCAVVLPEVSEWIFP